MRFPAWCIADRTASDRTSSWSVRAGTRRAGGSDGEDAARGGPNGSSALLDPNDEIRATAGSMAPGTKAREEMLVRYHKKRKERHFKKKIRYASRRFGRTTACASRVGSRARTRRW